MSLFENGQRREEGIDRRRFIGGVRAAAEFYECDIVQLENKISVRMFLCATCGEKKGRFKISQLR